MKSREDLVRALSNGMRYDYLLFWGPFPKRVGQIDESVLCQWYPASFTDGEFQYKTAEHFMMSQKAKMFNDDEAFQKILNAEQPNEAKMIGREVKNFIQEEWDEKSFDIVVKGNILKFSQNPVLKKFILSTKEILVEASPYDTIWGIGLSDKEGDSLMPEKWKGENRLGFALMKAREKLRRR